MMDVGGISLGEGSANSKRGSVRLQSEGTRVIDGSKDGACGKTMFEGVEGVLRGGGPGEGNPLFSKVMKGPSNTGISLNEGLVEVPKTKERTDLGHRGGRGPIGEPFHFY